MIDLVHMTKKTTIATMLNADLCDQIDAYILVEGIITVVGQGTDAEAIVEGRNNKEVVFKNCTPFTNCISKINNAEVDNSENLEIVVPMYNLLEYSDNYAKHQLVYGNIVEMNQMVI